MVGMVVVVVVVVAEVVGRVLPMLLMVAAGQAMMPTCTPSLGMVLLRCPQHLHISWHPLAQGQPRL